MTEKELLTLTAAPIYAALLQHVLSGGEVPNADEHITIINTAIVEAELLIHEVKAKG